MIRVEFKGKSLMKVKSLSNKKSVQTIFTLMEEQKEQNSLVN